MLLYPLLSIINHYYILLTITIIHYSPLLYTINHTINHRFHHRFHQKSLGDPIPSPAWLSLPAHQVPERPSRHLGETSLPSDWYVASGEKKQKKHDMIIVCWYMFIYIYTPSGKRLHSYGKSLCFMGKSTISIAIFNSFVYVYPRV